MRVSSKKTLLPEAALTLTAGGVLQGRMVKLATASPRLQMTEEQEGLV